MRSKSSMSSTAIAFFVALAIPLGLAAQSNQDHSNKTHHHYQLIDMGTFGGPNSGVPTVFDEINGTAGAQAISDAGAITGTADTSIADPLCYFDDCFYPNGFQLENGAVTNLGALPGGFWSFVAWTSRNGLVTGFSENGETDPLTDLPLVHGVLWHKTQITDLGTLSGGFQSFGQAVNNAGLAVGLATNGTSDPYSYLYSQILGISTGTQSRAFLWSQQDGMQDLGTLGGPDAWAAFVNKQGEVAGISYTSATANADNGPSCPPNVPSQDPFFWEKGTGMIDVGSFGGTCAVPQAFNNRGQLVGQSYLAGNATAHAFLWDKRSKTQLKDLGTLGGDNAAALWIDDAGDVVGYADLYNPGGCNGLPCVHHGFLWRNGVMTDLGTIGTDPCSRALSVNARGQVVGATAAICGGNLTRGFLWENGGPAVDLNSLVSTNEFALAQPVYINDRGEIAVTGTLANGDTHAILLVPCDEGHPGGGGCDYSLVGVSAANSVAATPRELSRRVPPATLRQHNNRFRFPILGSSN
jgi:probable HAF family extracellular repeat protein